MQLLFEVPNLSNIMERFQQAPEIVTPILQNALKASQVIMGSVTRGNVPEITGGLVASFYPMTISPLSYGWGPNKSYALFVEQGTGIYGPRATPIVPVTAKALAWTSGGQQFIRRSVKGMTPRLYMERILAAATPQLTTLFEQAEQTIIEAMTAE